MCVSGRGTKGHPKERLVELKRRGHPGHVDKRREGGGGGGQGERDRDGGQVMGYVAQCPC